MNPLMDIQDQEKETVRIGNVSSIGSILDNKEPSIKQKFLAEFIGTFISFYLLWSCCLY